MSRFRCIPAAAHPRALCVVHTGTGPEVFANTNAPPAVTSSAVIYSLRCMVPADIPLNQVLGSFPTAHIMQSDWWYKLLTPPTYLFVLLASGDSGCSSLEGGLSTPCDKLYCATGLPAASGDQDPREQHPVAQPRGSRRWRQCADQPAGDRRHPEVLRGSGGISGVYRVLDEC
jgi:Hydantoinase B/oxoprolinase